MTTIGTHHKTPLPYQRTCPITAIHRRASGLYIQFDIGTTGTVMHKWFKLEELNMNQPIVIEEITAIHTTLTDLNLDPVQLGITKNGITAQFVAPIATTFVKLQLQSAGFEITGKLHQKTGGTFWQFRRKHNPARAMIGKKVQVISGDSTRPAIIERTSQFHDDRYRVEFQDGQQPKAKWIFKSSIAKPAQRRVATPQQRITAAIHIAEQALKADDHGSIWHRRQAIINIHRVLTGSAHELA